MRCISDELIQKYVDREVTIKESSLVQGHLTTCSKCAGKVEERRVVANRIKKLLGSINKNEIHVPVLPESEYQRKTVYFHLKRALYVASAACLIILFFILHQKPKEEVEFVYSYGIESEYNANLPISEQEMVIEIIDSKGKLTRY